MYLYVDDFAFSSSSPPDAQTLADKIQALLEHIRGLDKSMDQARVQKLMKIKKAVADGTYHVSAVEVARHLIDHMQEP